MDKTSGNLNKQTYNHTRNLKRANLSYSLFKYYLETNHNFNFKDYKMLVNMHDIQKVLRDEINNEFIDTKIDNNII